MSGEADECSSDETGTGDIFINPFTYYLRACFPSISFCPFCYYCIKPVYSCEIMLFSSTLLLFSLVFSMSYCSQMTA